MEAGQLRKGPIPTALSLEIQFGRYNEALRRIGRCISFGCRGQDMRLMRLITAALTRTYPGIWAVASDHAYARRCSELVTARERLTGHDDPDAVLRRVAMRSNRKLLEQLLTESGQALNTKDFGHTLQMDVMRLNHVPPIPSTIIGFSRFGRREDYMHHVLARRKRLHWDMIGGSAGNAASIPEEWKPLSPTEGQENAVVMQSCIYCLSTRQFVAVVDETIEARTIQGSLENWVKGHKLRVAKFHEDIVASRQYARKSWAAVWDNIRLLEQNTWDREDAVEDTGTAANPTETVIKVARASDDRKRRVRRIKRPSRSLDTLLEYADSTLDGDSDVDGKDGGIWTNEKPPSI